LPDSGSQLELDCLPQVDAAAAAAAAAAADLGDKSKALEEAQARSAVEAATVHQQHDERLKEADAKLAALQKQLQVRMSLCDYLNDLHHNESD
jgi:sugar (pentulose or hexulose) kinase